MSLLPVEDICNTNIFGDYWGRFRNYITYLLEFWALKRNRERSTSNGLVLRLTLKKDFVACERLIETY